MIRYSHSYIWKLQKGNNMKNLSLYLLFLCSPIFGYSFKGTHYVAAYIGCEHLEDNHYVMEGFLKAASSSGATILKHSMHEFEPHGITAVCLLSESHASIHTYPEEKSVFVDLFTCGDHCKWEPFEAILKSYLKPQKIEYLILNR